MLYIFSTNQIKLVARKSKMTNNMGQRKYEFTGYVLLLLETLVQYYYCITIVYYSLHPKL
jgi:hypothetical protein